MTALPEDAPLTRRQARASQQQLSTPETEAADAPAQRQRRASTSTPVAAGDIPSPDAGSARQADEQAAAPAAGSADRASTPTPPSSGAPSPTPTGGLTRRQLRELERTGSIDQIPAPAAPVAPPVEEPTPSVALPPRSADEVVATPQKQGKAAKQQAAKAAQRAAEAASKAEADRAEAEARKAAEQAAADQRRAELQAAQQAAAQQQAAEQRAAAQQAPTSRPVVAPAVTETPTPTGSLFDVADRDDISEDPASTLSKGFGRDSMLVAALEAEKASQAETGVAFEDLLGNGMTTTGQITTSSLIIPVAPAQAEAGATSNSTGEILITGTIDLPRGLGSAGQDPNHFDGAGIDRLIEGDELPASVTAASPVAASKAVSSHGSTRDVVPATTNQSNKLLMTLAIAAAVLAAGVIAVLIIGFLGGAF